MLKLYEVTIRPQSVFGTQLAGDTLFGHLCWQFVYDASLLSAEFSELVSRYLEAPFLVVSSGIPHVEVDGEPGYAIPRPDLSLFGTGDVADTGSRRQLLEIRKEMKKKKHLFVGDDLNVVLRWKRLMSETDIAEAAQKGSGSTDRNADGRYKGWGYSMVSERTHNSINRLTETTGKGFDPYTTDVISFLPGVVLSVFVLVDEEICSTKSLQIAFERIGKFGYGRDASTGQGRFEVVDFRGRMLPSPATETGCLTLAPCCPQMDMIDKSWFQPVIRFGRHGGGAELTGNPFKNPVVMAAEGAVFKMAKALPEEPYLGRGISGISKAIPKTVMQGYSPYLPCNVEA